MLTTSEILNASKLRVQIETRTEGTYFGIKIPGIGPDHCYGPTSTIEGKTQDTKYNRLEQEVQEGAVETEPQD